MHARALILSAATAIGLVALSTSLPSRAQGAPKPIDALIVNPTNRPVPVTVLSTPAQPGEGSREIYELVRGLDFSTSINFSCSSTQTVPAGKRLVLQHLGGVASLFAPAALLYVAIRSQPSGHLVLYVPAAAPVSNPSAGLNSSAVGQQVHAYFDGAFEVCAGTAAFGLGGASISLHGYLVNKP